MQRYESYKPSGAQWLGDIPAHWTVTPAKRLFREVSEKNHPDAELLSVTQEFGVVPRHQLEQRVVMPTGQLQTFKLVREDDFVISLRSFQGGIEYSEFIGLVSPAYTILRKQREANSRYLKHLLKSAPFVSELNTSVTGIREGKNISFAEMAYSLLPLPPRAEQERIVAFLDQKTAEIDAAIAKKKRLIELLQEQKRILINRTILRGLNLNAPLSDSGVPWIGTIPEHWKVCAIKRLFKSMDYGLSESALGEGDFKYLNMGHIKDGRVSTENTGYLASAPDGLLLQRNDILFNRTNSFDLVGKSGIYLSHEEGVTFASYMVRIRVKDEICPGWANLLMNSESYLSFIRTLAFRSLNQANLNPTRLGAVSVPVPPKEEQEAIAAYLDEVSTQVDLSIRSIAKEVCGLLELRQTTIANVVTGKIKI